MVNTQESGRPNLDKLAAQIHEWNAKWWRDLDGNPIERDVGTMLMLMISEASEAMEGRRKSKSGKPLMDDKLPHREMAEVELGDIHIRNLDILGSGKFRAGSWVGMSVDEWVTRVRSGQYYKDRLVDLQDGSRLIYICDMITTAYTVHKTTDSLFSMLCRVLAATEALAELWGYDLYAAVAEKNEYNRTRHDHSIEGRKADGGKAW